MTTAAPTVQTALRRLGIPAVKLALTLLAFWLAAQHSITLEGRTVSVLQAVQTRLSRLSWAHAAPVLLAAAAIKLAGVGCAIVRWQHLLFGQRIFLPWGHVARIFMIGRFVGLFLPGTLGLDAYKGLDVSQSTGRIAEPLAATAVEKLVGLSGMLLVYLLTAPWGLTILGSRAPLILGVTLPVACGIVAGSLFVLTHPTHGVASLHVVGQKLPRRMQGPVQQLATALGAYAGQSTRLVGVVALSFAVHGATACVYVLTAIAVAAPHVHALEIIFASCIQIFATMLSPFTVAGAGVREWMQALLLAKTLGLSNSILSAALGFWVAEVIPALVGGILWWLQPRAAKPQLVRSTPALAAGSACPTAKTPS